MCATTKTLDLPEKLRSWVLVEVPTAASRRRAACADFLAATQPERRRVGDVPRNARQQGAPRTGCGEGAGSGPDFVTDCVETAEGRRVQLGYRGGRDLRERFGDARSPPELTIGGA